MLDNFYAVVPAGGSGTRLWPLSRAGHPKFLLPLTGTPRSLLQATRDRLADLAAPENTLIVTGTAHAAAVARQLPEIPESGIIVEPTPRDSCAAIGLAAALIAKRDPRAIMGSFAADHLVRDRAAFIAAVQAAAVAAADGTLMTVGIKPTHAETGFGYLRCGDPLGGSARRVVEFKEKPSLEVAQSYVASGEYLWNASMFVWRVDAFLAELARQRPVLHEGLIRIAEAWDTPKRDVVVGEEWPRLEKISVDYAVMEGAAADGRVGTVPGDFGWNDVGDFQTLGTVLPADDNGNTVLGHTSVLTIDAARNVISDANGRTVALLGVDDLIVIDTPDALLVCPRDRAQDVKLIVDALKERGSIVT